MYVYIIIFTKWAYRIDIILYLHFHLIYQRYLSVPISLQHHSMRYAYKILLTLEHNKHSNVLVISLIIRIILLYAYIKICISIFLFVILLFFKKYEIYRKTERSVYRIFLFLKPF